MVRAHHLALGDLDADGGEELRQRVDLLLARLVMGAVDELLPLLLQRLRRRHIGEDHEFFDQLVGVEAGGHDDPVHGAIGVQQDLAFG